MRRGKLFYLEKNSARLTINTLTSSSSWWKHTGWKQRSRSRGRGAAKATLRQRVDQAEAGTAWCIPLQTTRSLTSPLRKVSERPVGTTAGWSPRLHAHTHRGRPLPRWRWRRSRRWWPPGQRRRPPSAGCPPAWTSATGLPGNRSPQTTWRTRTLEKRQVQRRDGVRRWSRAPHVCSRAAHLHPFLIFFGLFQQSGGKARREKWLFWPPEVTQQVSLA